MRGFIVEISMIVFMMLVVTAPQTGLAAARPSYPFVVEFEPSSPLSMDEPITMTLRIRPRMSTLEVLSGEVRGDTVAIELIGVRGLQALGAKAMTGRFGTDSTYTTSFDVLLPPDDTSSITVLLKSSVRKMKIQRWFVTTGDTVEYWHGNPREYFYSARPRSEKEPPRHKTIRKTELPDSNTSQFRTEPAPRSEYQLLEMRRIEQEPLIARVVDRASVLRYQPASGKTQELYRPDKYSIHELTVSPNNKYIAAINISDRVTIPDSVPDAYYMYSLMVLHASGELAHRLDMDVRRYVWSPDGKQIAFLTFAPCRKAFWSSCPTGAWILDVETSELTKISEGAKEINWAAFDGAIYLFEHPRLYERGRVMRWDPVSGELQPTDYHDIYFSPDGKYYLSLWKDEGRPIRLYDAISNELIYDIVVRENLLPDGDIAVPFPESLGAIVQADLFRPPWGWVFNSGHYLMFTKEESTVETEGSGPVKIIVSKTIHSLTNSIYDVEQGKVIKQFEGDGREWVGSGNQVVVERDGKVVLEEMP